MNIIYRFLIGIVWLGLCLATSSCSEGEYPISCAEEASSVEWHTAKLNFHSQFESSSRADDGAYSPQNLDMICIRFKQASGKEVLGYAFYDAENESWNMTYQGSLTKGNNLSCYAIYFGNRPDLDKSTLNVSLSDETPVFVCKSGNYSVLSGDNVDLFVVMSPDCFRLRFKGTEELDFKYRGPSLFGNYDMKEDFLSTINTYYFPANGKIVSSENDFFSPYYYSDKGSMTALRIMCQDNVFRFKQDLYRNAEMTKAGQSNLILLPSVAPNNWYSDKYWSEVAPDISTSYTTTISIDGNKKYYSQVGIGIEFDYLVSALNSSIGEDDYELFLVWKAYDEDGGIVTEKQNYIPNWIDAEIVGEQLDYYGYVFAEETAYYTFEIKTYGVKTKISNIKISTF